MKHRARPIIPAVYNIDSASHAYLFAGPNGSEKQHAAEIFATKLVTQSNDVSQSESIKNRVQHHAHPDVTQVRPTGTAGILVEQLEEQVIRTLAQTPLEAKKRVFIIHAAHTIREQAASKLLKALEEPPHFVHFLLLTDRISMVLPTIVSRCQVIRFASASHEEITKTLTQEGVDVSQASAVTKLSGHDLQQARFLANGHGSQLRLASEQTARSLYQPALQGQEYHHWQEIVELSQSTAAEALHAAEQEEQAALEFASKRERASVKRDFGEQAKRIERQTRLQHIEQSFDLIAFWFRDLAYVKLKEAQNTASDTDIVFNQDRFDLLLKDAKTTHHSATTCWQAVQVFQKTKRYFGLNMNIDLLFHFAALEAKSAIMAV